MLRLCWFSCTWILSYTICVASLQLNSIQGRAASPKLTTVYQFPKIGAWLENLAVRPSGEVLVTRSDVPELWLINPEKGTASLIHTFPNVTGLSGITQIRNDVFAVNGLVLDLPTVTPTPGTSTIFKVDLSGPKPDITLIKRVPESIFFNGLTTLDARAGTILIADASAGLVYKFNVNTGKYLVEFDDPLLKPAVNAPFQIGVNGVKVLHGVLYFTSTTQRLLGRVAISKDAAPAGPASIVAQGFDADDFILTTDGTAFVATNPENTILKVAPKGHYETFAGSLTSLAVAGASALEFGTCGKVLYITTSGAQAGPVNVTVVEPGKLVKLEL
jgi:hypothetical protein